MSQEAFSDSQRKILEQFVTSTESNVFCLRNLPEVIKGALFSRYSRSTLGLRSLLLKEFICNEEESAFQKIVRGRGVNDEDEEEDQLLAIKRAQSFYDRILDGYGDDSIGELGGAHLAIENVSMIATKVIQDCRIGGSPLEKSTRYVYFDQKIDGEYQFYREPVLMCSAYRDQYVEMCNRLFETYSALVPPTTAMVEAQTPQNPDVSKAAYKASVRAKVLDLLRGLLPASTLTNMGVYGNGRFFETMIHKLRCSRLQELQDIGAGSFEELTKVIPSFVRRSEASHRHHKAFAEYLSAMDEERCAITRQHAHFPERHEEPGVRLVEHSPYGVRDVASAMLYEYCDKGLPELKSHCAGLSQEELARILDAGCSYRNNRRHKSPRALEHATFTFEIMADYGIYRDLQRHRIQTQERQLLTCHYGYTMPHELKGTEMEGPYCQAMEAAKEVYDLIAPELPEEAQYVVPMGYYIRWYFHINLRALQWLCELRSAPAGHPNYRYVAQTMAREVCRVQPEFERFLRFVDYDGHELGRLSQEQRKVEKLQERS